MPRTSATPKPITAAVRNAERTVSTALPAGLDLITINANHWSMSSMSRSTLTPLACGVMPRMTPVPSSEEVSRVRPSAMILRRSSGLGSVTPENG
jgi:hypothetical protein